MYFIGLDGGSTYVKGALISSNRILGTKVLPSGIDNNKVVEKLIHELLMNANISRKNVLRITSTGYSRRSLDAADSNVSEITAHGLGAKVTAPQGVNPSIVIDIGGQDSKIIQLDNDGAVKNFVMNDKCAAGTGKFIEVIAQILETTINEIGPLSLQSKQPCEINNTCVVFAQTEVISLLARKKDRRDILSGMHMSMAKRIAKMLKKFDKSGDILMTGGGAKNTGLIAALEDELMKEIYVANHPQFNGAIGAAIQSLKEYKANHR